MVIQIYKSADPGGQVDPIFELHRQEALVKMESKNQLLGLLG